MIKLKLINIGASIGAVFPEELLTRLKVHDGDTLFAAETKDGYLITPYDPSISDQLEAGREIMNDYSDAFKALAE
jgi:putative addiction module antidote